MELKYSEIFNKTILKSVSEYCKLNSIEDVDGFIKKCFDTGFNIQKYGLLGKTLNEGEKHLKTGIVGEKQVEIEVIREIRVEVPVEVIKEVYITDDKELERLKKLVKIYSMDQFNTNEEIIELIKKNKSLEKQLMEVSVPNIDEIGNEPEPIIVEVIKEVIVEVEKSNDKTLLLQETLQKLRKELSLKNTRIEDLEKINKQLESIRVEQGAVYLKGSNISETM